MLDFDLAQKRLSEAAPAPTGSETCPLDQAAGRVLAQAVTALLDSPPAHNSAMDGYAIRAADYAAGKPLPIQQRCYAGDVPAPLVPGQATRLFTGSLLPEGADTIVIQENCREADGQVEILQAPQKGQHVRWQGEDIARGTEILAAGTLLDAARVALLASQGMPEVAVLPRLKVGILTTGDELVAPGQPRAAQQIYNSNGPMLAALVRGLQAEPARVLHAADEPQALRAAFESLLADCDLVLSVGGVSVGERDLVKPTLEALGGELALWKVRMKPGKPVALAHIGGKPVVCLPGNPVSAYAVFALLVSPLVRRMQGRSELFPPVRKAVLRTETVRQDSREEFLRVQCRAAGETTELIAYRHQGSGAIGSLSWAHGLARIPADTPVADGTPVDYYDLAHWLS